MRLLHLSLLNVLLLMTFTLSAQDGETFTDAETGVTYTVELVTMANYPVALAFTPDGRLFYTEKTTGNVRMISADGELQTDPVISLPTSAVTERGMLGIAIDSNYAENGFIWVAHISEPTARDLPENRIVRFYEQDGVGSDPEIMFAAPLENNALIHHGGNLHFDADGYLFYSIGDNELPANSQDLTTPQGAMHRFEVTDNGLIPAAGNPFGDDNSIFAYGLRNSFDFDIDAETGRIYATENGQHCDDEINLILRGFNYGAGEGYVCGGTAEGVSLGRYLPAILSFTPTEAPTGIIVYDNPAVPEWQGDLFFCAWNNGLLRRVVLNEARNQVENVVEIDLGGVQCKIDIEIAPDGSLYFTTVGENTGAIYRIVPIES
ncbi:MAG: PQQ-dependent sugar dehydrogenase [Aggregatilineales bacterium]